MKLSLKVTLTDVLAPDGDGSSLTAVDAATGDSATAFFDAGEIADARIANNITASNYLPLAGGTLTGELVVDNLGAEFTAGDDHSDCSAFSATGGGIYFDDSEGIFKKCQDNVLTDLDTGGSGDFSGPGSSTDNAVVRFDGTGGKTGQNSSVIIDDSDNITGVVALTTTGTIHSDSIVEGTDIKSWESGDGVPAFRMYDIDGPASGEDDQMAWIYAEYQDGAGGEENADLHIGVSQDGSITAKLSFDESDDQWETDKVINSTGGFTGTTLTVDDMTLNGSTITGISVGGLPDNIVDNGMMADNSVDSDNIVDDEIVNADINSSAAIAISKTALAAGTNITLSTNTLNVDDAFLANDGDVGTGVYDFGGATSVEIPNGTNPTTDAAGEIAVDSDDNFIEIYGSASRSIPTEFPVPISVYKPNEWDDDQRDFMPIFTNNTGATITITKIYAMADVDDSDFRIEEYDADGSSNEALVKAETCDTGSGPYTNDAQSTITNASVENGHVLVLDFDDTDVPDYLHLTIWYTVGGVD